jgi:hypothetical protein
MFLCTSGNIIDLHISPGIKIYKLSNPKPGKTMFFLFPVTQSVKEKPAEE